MSILLSKLLSYCVISIVFMVGTAYAIDKDIEIQLMQIDFTQALSDCEFIDPYNPESSQNYGGFDPREILANNLTDSEKKLLAVYRKPNVGSLGMLKSALAAISYASQHLGKLPTSGLELVLGDLDVVQNGDTDLKDVLEMSNDELLRFGFYGVNPGTGSFIRSFSDPNWHKLGIYIEPVDGDDAIQYFPMPVKDGPESETKVGECPFQTWRIVIFGEMPNTVIVDKHVWRRIGSVDEENAKPCGGCGKKKDKKNDENAK